MKEYGVDRVDCLAAKGFGMIGYKVWPKMGFDGKIGRRAASLPDQFSGAKTIQELYAMPGGRQTWEEYGGSIDLSLDMNKADRAIKLMERMLSRTEKTNE